METIPEVTLSHWDNISAIWTFVAESGPRVLEEPSAGARKRGEAQANFLYNRLFMSFIVPLFQNESKPFL